MNSAGGVVSAVRVVSDGRGQAGIGRGTLRLANPPVVEVGIDFLFDPDPEKEVWDPRVALAFIDRFKQTSPYVEVVHTDEIRIEKRSPKGIPEKISGKTSFDHIKAHDQQESKWIQVGEDQLGYRLLRCGGNYPGFEAVETESLEKLAQYVDHFRPTAVRRAMLTYVDVIQIPLNDRNAVELEEYFHIGARLPEAPFGPVRDFACSFLLPSSPAADRLRLKFSTGPMVREHEARFRMDWQSICDNVKSLNEETICQRLRVAHEHLRKCFLASFTNKGLQLFRPEGIE